MCSSCCLCVRVFFSRSFVCFEFELPIAIKCNLSSDKNIFNRGFKVKKKTDRKLAKKHLMKQTKERENGNKVCECACVCCAQQSLHTGLNSRKWDSYWFSFHMWFFFFFFVPGIIFFIYVCYWNLNANAKTTTRYHTEKIQSRTETCNTVCVYIYF